MVRIPEVQIERRKQEASVQRLGDSQGLKLKRHGADLIGLCPFHDDHEPSLVISPKNNLWHCLEASQCFELPDDLPVPEPGQSDHQVPRISG